MNTKIEDDKENFNMKKIKLENDLECQTALVDKQIDGVIETDSNVAASDTSSLDTMPEFQFSTTPNLETLRHIQARFVRERNWNQYQTPRNLLLALVNEVGELAEIFQWKGEVQSGLNDWPSEEREHLEQELSDVLIYLIRLAEECRVDLPRAAAAKIQQNKLKYPIEKFYGLNKKYNK